MKAHPTCDTCRYYTPSNEENGHPIYSLGICSAIPHGTDCTDWDRNFDDVLRPEFKNTKAFCLDGSGYHAVVAVRPDFYCAMYERGESET